MIEVSEPLPAAISASSQAPSVGVGRQRLAAVGDDVVHGVQPAVVVVAQAPPLVIDHGLELRQAVGHRQNLVDLLLVLDRGEAHLGMREHVGEFVGHRVGIDRHRHDAERLRRHHRRIELRPVGADDRHGVAALQAEPMQADRIGADLVEQLRPGQRLPDAQILVPHRRPVAEVARHCGSAISERCPPRREHGSPRLPPNRPRQPMRAVLNSPHPPPPRQVPPTIRMDRRGPVKSRHAAPDQRLTRPVGCAKSNPEGPSTSFRGRHRPGRRANPESRTAF